MQLAIISGGSKGLGAALCEQYLARGFEVVEFSRSASQAYSVAIDLSQAEQAGGIINEALEPLTKHEWQEIVVISNAGILTPVGPVSRKKRDAVIANLNTNFVSSIIFMSEVLAHFQHNNGKKTMASISSGAALGERAGWSLYCAAKAGMEHFIRCVAKEQDIEQHPFKLMNIDPGLIDTDMQTAIRQSSIDDFPSLEQFIQRKEAGLLIPPEKVAEGVIQIIDESTIGNGQRISVHPH
jgi:benzil reductase ((S)-benzoin forming)